MSNYQCKKCGKLLSDDQTVCHICGTPVQRTDTVYANDIKDPHYHSSGFFSQGKQSFSDEAVQHAANNSGIKKSSNNGKLALIAAALIIVIGASALLIPKLFKDDIQTSDSNSSSASEKGTAYSSEPQEAENTTYENYSDESSLTDAERLRKSMGDWDSPNDSSLSDTEKLRRSMGKDGSGKDDVTATTTAPTTTTAAPKSAEKPVPEMIKKMLETTDPSYQGQPGGPTAAFMTYYGYLGHEGTQEDEMWFQDMDGDGDPDLVVGGFSVGGIEGMGQGQVYCFDVMINGGTGGTVHLRPDYAHLGKHGHNAFVMQAYKESSGKLVFMHTQFYRYTSDPGNIDPKYAGTFTIYKYDFNTTNPDQSKREILGYSYDTRQGEANAFSAYLQDKGRISASQAKSIYNSTYSAMTPLKAIIKTINYQQYMNSMDQQQRKKALMDSYYSFSYTADNSIKPFGSEVFNKI